MTRTWGEVLGPAMEMEDPAEAAAYFEATVQEQMQLWGVERAKAEADVRHNLLYYAGYYSEETVARVRRLFGHLGTGHLGTGHLATVGS